MTDEANRSNIPERYRPDPVERAAGSLPAAAAAGALAAFAGTPLAALLPVLTQTLAAGRQQARIAQALQAINQDLETQRARLDELTDQQYQIIAGAVGAVFETIDQRKLDYLRCAVRNAEKLEGIIAQEAVALGRLIRDISADEADFLLKNFGYEAIHVSSETMEHRLKVLQVPPGASDSLVVDGLVTLGLLEDGDLMFDHKNFHRFSRLAGKLLVLLRAN